MNKENREKLEKLNNKKGKEKDYERKQDWIEETREKEKRREGKRAAEKKVKKKKAK